MEVLIAPDNRLRIKTKPVKKLTPVLLSTTKQMVALTKTFVDPEGVGLASTQVGLNGQFFVIRHENDRFEAYFNPKIHKYSKTLKVYLEGCLSLPDYWGEVNRSLWVDVSYINYSGQKIEERLRDIDAWIFQHEYDHLLGKLFVDHVLAEKTRFFKVVGRDRAGVEIFEEIKL